MFGALLGISGIASILVFAEFLNSRKVFKQTELARKFVHVLSAGFIATWPFFMSFSVIQLLSVLLFGVVLLSRVHSIFGTVHNVDRQTYGEFLFPISVFLCAALSSTEWIFAAAMLHLGLADGLAAIAGSNGNGHFKYTVFGQKKSLIGTSVFYVVSVIVTGGVVLWADPASFGPMALPIVVWLPITATLIENFSVWGTDNLFVPLVVVASLNVSLVAL